MRSHAGYNEHQSRKIIGTMFFVKHSFYVLHIIYPICITPQIWLENINWDEGVIL